MVIINKTTMRKQITIGALLFILSIFLRADSCDDGRPANTTALDEQAHTELNQRNLMIKQPPPSISWSLERDNLIKRFKLQNDRAVMFYMYVFIEGISQPIGYYQVNKVSSVNSQLTNTAQLVSQYQRIYNGNGGHDGHVIEGVLPSPAEDGSYGENGNAVFGFIPEDVYIETNMKFIVSTIPLAFKEPVNRLAIVSSDEVKKILETTKNAMK
jgi:hypothetical protein